MSELIAAIDAGTTGVRSMIFDLHGAVVSSSYEEFHSAFPKPSLVEQNALDWWDAACSTLKQSFKKGKISSEYIAALSISNQRETIVPISEAGMPLRNAIVWQDRRTVPQCDWIRETCGADRIYSTTGLTIDPYFSAPKILWIKENEPEVFSKTHKFLLVHDFIAYCLTGRTVTDYSNASRTMLFSIEYGTWAGDLLSIFGISEDKLPEAVPSGEKIGEVTTKAAKESGLKEGTPVIAGGGDQQCAALGVGVIHEGMIKSTTGTGTFMLAHTEKPRFDPKRRMLVSRHVLKDCFVSEASMFTTGAALRWFRDNLSHKDQQDAQSRRVDPYEVMTELAEGIPPGSEGVVHIPHFVGAGAPYWNPAARGIFAGLALGHTRGHLVRAILEGVSYDIRNNLNVLRELGLSTDEIRVTGGAAKSDIWMQIQADVLGIPVIKTKVEEATALGAAILASIGVGLHGNEAAAVEEMVKSSSELTPNPENQERYDRGFVVFRNLYDAVSEIAWE